jgi:hypothetical protein
MNLFLEKIPPLPEPEDLAKNHEPYASLAVDLNDQKWWDWVCCKNNPSCIVAISESTRFELRVNHDRSWQDWRSNEVGKLTLSLDYVTKTSAEHDSDYLRLIDVTFDHTNLLIKGGNSWGTDVKGRKALYGAAKEIYDHEIARLARFLPLLLRDLDGKR